MIKFLFGFTIIALSLYPSVVWAENCDPIICKAQGGICIRNVCTPLEGDLKPTPTPVPTVTPLPTITPTPTPVPTVDDLLNKLSLMEIVKLYCNDGSCVVIINRCKK
jgi:hypothetical protein